MPRIGVRLRDKLNSDPFNKGKTFPKYKEGELKLRIKKKAETEPS
jgi:hypothetical protein